MKELEMILQAISQLGASGKEAFIWWLIADKGLPFLLGMFCVISGFYVAIKIIRALSCEGEIIELRDSMGIGYAGMSIRQSDLKKMREWVEARKVTP